VTKLRPDTLAMTAMLALLTALGPLSTDFYLPSLPDIARVFGTTIAGAQATLSSFLFGFAFGQILYGPLSDRIGRKPVLLTGLGIFLAATVLCAFAPSVDMLIVGRFLQALGASGPIVLARAIVRDLYEGPRAGRELARMGMIMGVVPAIAPVLGGVLQQQFGWRSTFIATLLVAAVLGIVTILKLPETIRQKSTEPLSIFSILKGFRHLLRNRVYRVYAALVALAYAGLFAFISGSSFVLINLYGLDPVQFGLSFAFGVLGFITGTILAQKLVARRGLDGVIALGVIALAAGGLVMTGMLLAIPQSSLVVTLPMAIYAMGVGLTMPQAQASALMPFPDRAGAASSLTGLMQMTLAGLALVITAMGLTAWAVFHFSAAVRRTTP
jgi:DHA1 family bicyclomycin/chloramphenicol resistance-like MFS transporter